MTMTIEQQAREEMVRLGASFFNAVTPPALPATSLCAAGRRAVGDADRLLSRRAAGRSPV